MVNGDNITKEEFLTHIAEETTRMAAPGHFYGHVLKNKGTKDKVTSFFVKKFPIKDLWEGTVKPKDYQNWHKRQINGLSRVIDGHIKQLPKKSPKKPPRTSFSIAAKLMDTFMHQLMKYERFRYLYKSLYLPLDREALSQLSRKTIHGVEVPEKLHQIASEYKSNPYSISAKKYIKIQEKLSVLLKHFNKDLPKDCRLKARIELNCILWPQNKKRKRR